MAAPSRSALHSCGRSLPTVRLSAHVPYRHPAGGQSRHFFGVGEIIGVLANPAETVRSLTESRKMLEEARREISENNERQQISPKHTFSALPGFFQREAEIKVLERTLSGVPTLTILFGGTSAGKTALLRQVLTQDKYHVLAFDLRIAGFADLSSLFFSLAAQMEQYFLSLKDVMEGYDQFEKESWTFKHARLEVGKRLEAGGEVKTSDIAHLMELFQSCLLKYWEFEPDLGEEEIPEGEEGRQPSKQPKERKVEQEAKEVATEPAKPGDKPTRKKKPPQKKIPVLFFDEAHKLPLLIKTDEAMKCILDAMLVLTKQDRLIHCVHATSDSFFMQWLNVLHHATFVTIGDATYKEAQTYFQNKLADMPDSYKSQLDFEAVYDVFGGKLAHIANYLEEFVNAEGDLPLLESSHFLQANSLLNLQLVHSRGESETESADAQNSRPRLLDNQAVASTQNTGFESGDLLYVIRKLADAQPVPWQLPYFDLSHKLGTVVVDSMIRGRLLQLRWTPPVSAEGKNPVRRPWHGPVVLPATPVMQAAMRQTLEKRRDQELI